VAQLAVQCPNHEINQSMCPCLETMCANHGICCQCLRNHIGSTQWPLSACMKGVPRPASTMSLSKTPPTACPNHEVNLEACLCTADSCERRGYCCVCVRHHWEPEGGTATACMRQ